MLAQPLGMTGRLCRTTPTNRLVNEAMGPSGRNPRRIPAPDMLLAPHQWARTTASSLMTRSRGDSPQVRGGVG